MLILTPGTAVDGTRRRLLRCLAAGPVALALAAHVRAAHATVAATGLLQDEIRAPRSLSLVSTHTAERLSVCYFANGSYLPTALEQLNHLLRDHRTGDLAPIDPRLFDQLHALARGAGCEPQFEIISGYRSPATNAKLRAASSGVARHSMHMDGRAMDVRLAGTSCSKLRDLALAMGAGGVGYYGKSDFVHLDTGRVRAWTG
jgi:uncharacterized protein YcbK (DUF882 family)